MGTVEYIRPVEALEGLLPQPSYLVELEELLRVRVLANERVASVERAVAARVLDNFVAGELDAAERLLLPKSRRESPL